MDKDVERALKMAQDEYGNSVRVVSIGENDKYKLITLTNQELERMGDGLEYPWLLINKETGKELFASGMIFDPIDGFEDFTYDLNYTEF